MSNLYPKNTLYIYTDGAYKPSKQYVGIGVFFDDGSNRKISRCLDFDTETSQRAEYKAVIVALKELLNTQDITKQIVIVSDSMYVVSGMTKWCYNWIKQGWKRSNNKEIANINLIKT